MPTDTRAIQKAMAEEYERETGEKWCEPPLVCDMDGVLTDFVGGFEAYHEISPIQWEPGEYSIAAKTGISLDTLPTRFWQELPEIDTFCLLAPLIAAHPFAVIATRVPSGAAEMFQAKARWLGDHGLLRLPVPCTRLKAEVFASYPNAVLIDDSDEEIDAWLGPKLLVPRPWNSARDKNPVAAVIFGLGALRLLGPALVCRTPRMNELIAQLGGK